MTKILSMVSHKNYNLNANEGFVIFFTFKLIACYFDAFILEMKSQSIFYLLNGSEHIHWILDIESEGHPMWVIWTSGLRECKGNFIFQSQALAVFDHDLTNVDFFVGVVQMCRIVGSGTYPPPPKSS